MRFIRYITIQIKVLGKYHVGQVIMVDERAFQEVINNEDVVSNRGLKINEYFRWVAAFNKEVGHM